VVQERLAQWVLTAQYPLDLVEVVVDIVVENYLAVMALAVS
jgi:hypothetical protein